MDEPTASASVDYHGQTMTFTYYTDKANRPEWRAWLGTQIERYGSPENLELLDEIMVQLVASWSMEDDEGHPLPITLENMAYLRQRHPAFFGAFWTKLHAEIDARRPSGATDALEGISSS